MSVETDLERSEFLRDFGVPAVFGSLQIIGIFDNDIQEIAAGGTASFAVEVPRFLCRSSDVFGVVEGDAITIAGVLYHVLTVMDDGQGMTELRLEKQ